MALYLSTAQIEAAIGRLAISRAKSRLHDFLVVKRTLAIKGTSSVAIAQSEPAFMQALDEISSTNLNSSNDVKYFNPFDGSAGYRPDKYKSNGPNTTIGNNAWRNILHLTTDKPRKAEIASGYEAKLEDFFLSADAAIPKPNIYDIATWYFRAHDVSSLIGSSVDLSTGFEALRHAFTADLQLSGPELAALFESSVPPMTEQMFASDPGDPEQYLPSVVKHIVAAQEFVAVDGGGGCSLELVTALAAKPFVILSGPSGTGKSRVALKLAERVQALSAASTSGAIFELVPVGPDWTSPRRLLGYRTPFGATRKLDGGGETNDAYEITPTLRLILRALHPDASGIPHFLILDEMNLSHVERYFAPFLSLMEATSILERENAPSLLDREALRVVSEVLNATSPDSPEAVSANLLVKNGGEIVLPYNLLIVGTVNVDDTTYMFSPKVLDRAHVIEVQAKTPEEYFSGDESTDGVVSAGTARQLLKVGVDAREDGRFTVSGPGDFLAPLITEIGIPADQIESANAAARAVLHGCYKLLAPVGFQFGYRTIKEVFQYIYFYVRAEAARADGTLSAIDLDVALDLAIIQKVLPKLHGNRRSLLGSLNALAAFLEGVDANNSEAAGYAIGAGQRVEILPQEKLVANKLPRSVAKLREMERRLSGAGYVSFVS